VRATVSFSKNLVNHIEAIKYFIRDYNLTRSAALPGWYYQFGLPTDCSRGGSFVPPATKRSLMPGVWVARDSEFHNFFIFSD